MEPVPSSSGLKRVLTEDVCPVSPKQNRLKSINTETEEDDCASIVKCGMVRKMSLKNFMCHTHLEVDLNLRTNFIVGRNGSGKSAILTALVVGLGGSASTTNRGSSLKQFIKKGMKTCTIEVTLYNGKGTGQYKVDVYGESIKVTRTLNATSGSSSYKIQASDGTVISTKRSELSRIITSFNIQIDNPISVLDQDSVRTFLTGSNPKEKYNLFMRATRLQELWDIAWETLTAKDDLMRLLIVKKSALVIVKKQLDDLELHWNKLKSVQDYRTKLMELHSELHWSRVIFQEKDLEIILAKKKDLDKQSCALTLTIEDVGKRESELNGKLHSLELVINKLREDNRVAETEYSESKRTADQCKEDYTSKFETYKRLELELNRNVSNMESLLSEISRVQEVTDGDRIEKCNQFKEQMAQVERSLEKLFAKQELQGLNYNQVLCEETKRRENIQHLLGEKAEGVQRLKNFRQQIASLRKDSSDQLLLYGNFMPVLVKRIEEAFLKGMFSKQPIGPLGICIKVCDASWAPAVESFLGGFVKAFCVNNMSDNIVLNKIIAQVCGRDIKPTVITSKFFDRVHDITSNMVHAPEGTTSMLNALIISNTVVHNCLIDQREIESILLVPTSTQAFDLLSHAKSVPKNCKRAITKKGEQFYPDPNFKTYSTEIKARARFLQVSMADIIKDKEEELRECELNQSKLEKDLHYANALLKKDSVKLSELKAERSKLQEEVANVTETKNNLKDSAVPELTCVKTLFLEKVELKKVIDANKKKEKVLWDECETLKLALLKLKGDMEKMQENFKLYRKEELSREEQIEAIRADLTKIDGEKSKNFSKLQMQRDACALLMDKIDEHRTQLAIYLPVAIKAHPERIETSKPPKSIESEINVIDELLGRVEVEHGSYEDVGLELYSKDKSYKMVKAALKRAKKGIKFLVKALHKRKGIYVFVQRYVTARLNQSFVFMLNERKYVGEVIIDHSTKFLEIKASPRDISSSQDTKTLSGGERSYSTVVYIMALWDVAGPPFHFLDEFDVFMDKVNRRITLQMMKTQALRKISSQFVFLTPQDLSSISASSDITIHKMQDPRKN